MPPPVRERARRNRAGSSSRSQRRGEFRGDCRRTLTTGGRRPATVPRASGADLGTRPAPIDLAALTSRHEPHLKSCRAARRLEIARHYIRELIYGANDGIITTFAVVAGVAGGGLRSMSCSCAAWQPLGGRLVDGGRELSLDSLARERARNPGTARGGGHPTRHGLATFLAFVAAGALPLLPYLLPALPFDRFAWSIVVTLLALFAVGASRALVANVRWWRGGTEMLVLGGVVAAVAYSSGAFVASLMP